MVDSTKPTDVADSIRRAVNEIPRHERTSDPKRDDRTAIMAFLIEMQQRRTQGAQWTAREQLVAEYIMQWADQL